MSEEGQEKRAHVAHTKKDKKKDKKKRAEVRTAVTMPSNSRQRHTLDLGVVDDDDSSEVSSEAWMAMCHLCEKPSTLHAVDDEDTRYEAVAFMHAGGHGEATSTSDVDLDSSSASEAEPPRREIERSMARASTDSCTPGGEWTT